MEKPNVFPLICNTGVLSPELLVKPSHKETKGERGKVRTWKKEGMELKTVKVKVNQYV